MKKSRSIPLVLLGSMLLLTGCAPDGDDEDSVTQETKQNAYTSQADCQKDWGNDARDCKQGTPVTGHGTTYLGPRYMYNHGSSVPMILDTDGTTRAAPNSYLARPGAVSTAHSVTSTRSVVSGGRGGSISRGGFGGAHGSFGG